MDYKFKIILESWKYILVSPYSFVCSRILKTTFNYNSPLDAQLINKVIIVLADWILVSRSAASRLREARVAIVTLVTNVTPGSIVTIVTLGVLANGSSMVKSCIFRHSSLRYARDHVVFRGTCMLRLHVAS